MKISYITGCMFNNLIVDDVCISPTTSHDGKRIEPIKHVYDRLLDVLTLDVNDICDFLLPFITSQFMKHVMKDNGVVCHGYFFQTSDMYGIISIRDKNTKLIRPSTEIYKEMVYHLINDTVEGKDEKNIENMCLFLCEQIKMLLYTYVEPKFLYTCGQCGDSIYEYSVEIRS